MRRAGYVLTGGRSSRMGKDKALLPFQNRTLVEWVAQNVEQAAGSATLIGPADQYAFLGMPVIEDRRRGCGPLSGIEAALSQGTAEWSLIAACDMPHLTVPFLSWILEEAERTDAEAVLPCGPSGRPEPLCAAYRRRCLPEVSRALDEGRYKVTTALSALRIQLLPLLNTHWLSNANTPEEWQDILRHTEVASG